MTTPSSRYAPNSILSVYTDKDGHVVIQNNRSTFDPRGDYRIVNCALEFTYAKRRGVYIDDATFVKHVTGDMRYPSWQHHIAQGAMLVFTALAVGMIAQPDASMRLIGFIVGAAIQPLWIITTWRARQWGFLALAVWYLGTFAQGIANHLS